MSDRFIDEGATEEDILGALSGMGDNEASSEESAPGPEPELTADPASLEEAFSSETDLGEDGEMELSQEQPDVPDVEVVSPPPDRSWENVYGEFNRKLETHREENERLQQQLRDQQAWQRRQEQLLERQAAAAEARLELARPKPPDPFEGLDPSDPDDALQIANLRANMAVQHARSVEHKLDSYLQQRQMAEQKAAQEKVEYDYAVAADRAINEVVARCLPNGHHLSNDQRAYDLLYNAAVTGLTHRAGDLNRMQEVEQEISTFATLLGARSPVVQQRPAPAAKSREPVRGQATSVVQNAIDRPPVHDQNDYDEAILETIKGWADR